MQKYCQMCGMPIKEGLYGTQKGGKEDKEYCKYYLVDGEFTFKGTMEEMIELCVPNMVKANQKMSEDEARKIMKEFFPSLKYWANKH